MGRSLNPKDKQKEPGSLVQMDKTAELYRELLRKKPRPLLKSDWRK